MSICMNVHGTTGVTAKKASGGSSHWLELTIESENTLGKQQLELTLFFDDKKQRDALHRAFSRRKKSTKA